MIFLQRKSKALIVTTLELAQQQRQHQDNQVKGNAGGVPSQLDWSLGTRGQDQAKNRYVSSFHNFPQAL